MTNAPDKLSPKALEALDYALAAHGCDESRWPEDVRAFARHHGDHRDIASRIQEAKKLDGLLSVRDEPSLDPGQFGITMAHYRSAMQSQQNTAPVKQLSFLQKLYTFAGGTMTAMGGAAAAIVGIVAGLTISPDRLPPEVELAQYISEIDNFSDIEEISAEISDVQ